jgi:hypothetical protein
MFMVYDKVKPDIENIRGLNLAVVKLRIIRVTKLPLQHCFPKPVLTEDLYIVQKEEFAITYYVCDMYHWYT